MEDKEIEGFIASAALPTVDSAVEDDIPNLTPARFIEGARENIVIGSQLGIIEETVSGELREQVALTLLFAQLTAVAQQQAEPATAVWFDRYVAALRNLGWRVTEDTDSEVLNSTKIDQAHKAVTGVLAAALGPQAAVAATITAVLDGLVKMSEDSPWITLYSNKSHRVNAQSFAAGSITGSDTDANLSMLHMTMTTEMTVSQFMFFRSNDTISEFAYRRVALAGNRAVFRTYAGQLRQRLGPFFQSYVADAPLPTPGN